ncbi:MAG: hypothetical protein LUD77_08850 [Clostridiales bacterium]|nr:hypothetical protein [Clostridiales bacterium]
MKLNNFQMETLMNSLKPLLSHRNKVGYFAARNTRILREALTEYFIFKERLIRKYGQEQFDGKGKPLHQISITPDMEGFEDFSKEFETVGKIEHEVGIMTMPYKEVIGILSGEEILNLDIILTE